MRMENGPVRQPDGALFILVLDDDVLQGARNADCAAHWGDHNHMLKDAMTGKLSSIPKGCAARCDRVPAI
jgi:hypothetical protein